MTEVSERTYVLDEELAELARSAPSGGDLLVLPEFLGSADGETFAAFAGSAQELRVDLADQGVVVQLAVPDGAQARPYEQHFVEVVLPVVVALPGSIVATARIVAWLRQRHSREPGEMLRYREAHWDEPRGQFVVRELVGSADAVAQALERAEPAPREVPASNDPT